VSTIFIRGFTFNHPSKDEESIKN